MIPILDLMCNTFIAVIFIIVGWVLFKFDHIIVKIIGVIILLLGILGLVSGFVIGILLGA